MPYPTTLVLLSLIASVTALGWQGTVDGAAVTSIFGAIVSGVLVGHYVRTANETHTPPAGSTTTVVTPASETTTVAAKKEETL